MPTYCTFCGEMDYSDLGDRPCYCQFADRLLERPTPEEECHASGHAYYGNEADCEDGAMHHNDEPCLCGRCYCGAQRYDRFGRAGVEVEE